ncbi:MAG: nascent polypeptide-associated complex protein [Candidatus Methanofastidiosia archaeon]
MMPGMNPRKMQKLMKQMGMSQEEINAIRVTIETPDGNLVFEKPQVTKTHIQGQSTFQIIGSYKKEEAKKEVVIPKEDIEIVMQQTGVSSEKAKEMLMKSEGDIAQAIVELQNEEK